MFIGDRIMEDGPINVKIKLAALWVAVMFCYVYDVVLTFFKPGMLEEIIAGDVPLGSQVSLLGAAILMVIPSLMIFLALTLKPKVNRGANIILGIVYIVVNLSNLLSLNDPWAYMVFYNVLESVLALLIIWYAWNWPKQDG